MLYFIVHFNYNHDNHVPSVSTDFDSKNVQVVQCLFIGRQPRYLCSIHGPAVERIFRAWVEDWEEVARTKNDCVEEASRLTKYKGLVFNDPDSGSTFSVWDWDRNMEFRRGRGNGWFVVGVWC